MPLSPTPDLLWLESDGTLWQDFARTTPATATNDPVRSWDDASAAANHAKQSTSNYPTLKLTQTPSGKPGILWDGANSALIFNIDTVANFSAFFVVNQTGDNALMGLTGGSAPQVRIGQSGSNVLSTFDNSNNPQSSTLAVAQGVWQYVAFIRSGTTVTFWQNGISYGTGTFDPAGTSHGGDQLSQIGAFITNSNVLNGYLAAVLLYGSVLGTTDRQSVESYLNTKYFTGGGGSAVGANAQHHRILLGAGY